MNKIDVTLQIAIAILLKARSRPDNKH